MMRIKNTLVYPPGLHLPATSASRKLTPRNLILGILAHFKHLRHFILLLACVCLLPFSLPPSAHALCARVKLEILQELTFERVAFDAMMKIHNESDIPLTDIWVEVSLKNVDGEDVSDLFFVRLSSMDHIDAVDGSGTVPAFSTAEIHWLIVPSAGAGGEAPQGQVYFAGATLGYNMGGAQEVTEVVPDSIVVKPQPMLLLDYFEPRFVYGDDPFTDETEAPVPYHLGVRVQNIGYGAAKNLVIDSGQPKIVENEHGLLVDFRILGSEVGREPGTNSLLVNFGDIGPSQCGTARWQMVSTLSGEFIAFDASFSHADELGGELTSLIQETRAHWLVHDVLVDLPDRDRIRDFLAYDRKSHELLVFESDNIDTGVTDVSGSATLTGAPSSSNPEVTLQFTPTAGAVYVRLPDPADGNIQIASVTRSDGKELLPDNFWISSEREEHQWYAYVNIFDVNSTGSYTIRYLTGDVNDTQAPESELVIEEPSFSENPTYVNQHTEFLFLATDDLSGVQKIRFAIDGDPFEDAVNPFMFSQRPAYADGPHTIAFYSVDNEGNEETPKSVDVYLDTQAPIIDTFSVSHDTITPNTPGHVQWLDRSLPVDYRLSDDIGQVTAAVQILSGQPDAPVLVWEHRETVASGTLSQITWEGVDSQEILVPPGTYTVRLKATDPLGHSITSEGVSIEVLSYFSEHALYPCDDCDQQYPDIAGDVVVWQDNRNGNWDIYLYDLTQHTGQNITPQPGDQTHPATDGSRVVWQDSRSGHDDIYLYDRATAEERIIEDNPGSQAKPAISGDWIVWQDNRYGNWDIYAYNLSTAEKRHLTEDGADQINPSISGQIVVWEDYRHGLGEIYAYDLDAGQAMRLTEDTVNQTDPVVSDGKIAWVDQQLGNRQIFLDDLAGEAASQITGGASDYAQVSLEGAYLVYTDYAQGIDDPNPQLHILDTSYFLLLTTNAAPQEESDICGSRAVWQDFRSEHWQIYTVDVRSYLPDQDGDGVFDAFDACPDTPESEAPDSNGCSLSQKDGDGDGMRDGWELEYFSTLDRDGTGDFDGDGISDLDECLAGTNPASPINAPSIPVICWPEDGTEVTMLSPALMIENSTDPDSNPVTYQFELYADEAMTSLVAGQANMPEGQETTSWTVPATLSDNTWYFWRVRATDGIAVTKWAYGRFFVNTENDPPGSFVTSSPQDGTEVDTQRPTLEVSNSVDADHDRLTYTFEVYADSGMNTLVAAALDIEAGQQGTTGWGIDTDLDDNTWYFWRVIATDEHGAQTATPLASFLVNTSNHAPVMAGMASPASGSEVDTQELDLVVINASDQDADGLTYFFELDRINTFDSLAKRTSGEIPEGTETTSWPVSDLVDSTLYYWRAKVSDGFAESYWVYGSFFVNTANDNPATPTVRNPGPMAWVDTPTPTLEVNCAPDADHDSVSYEFEIYADDPLSNLIAQATSDIGAWVVPSPLDDRNWYYWRVRAKDEHDAVSAWTEPASSFVKDNGINDPPHITLVEPSIHVETTGDPVVITWEDMDPDSNATIALYYDTDASGADGMLIVDGLKENPGGQNDSYVWNISGMALGTYHLYATILDETSSYTAYAPGSITITKEVILDLPSGWSMVSLPIDATDKKLKAVFPNAVVVYRYDKGAGYVRVKADQALTVGKGYWILLDQAASYTITGQPIESYTHPVSEKEWAMIGGCTDPAKVVPQDCNVGVIYRYVQGIGYQRVRASERLKSGEGYWILLTNVIEGATITVEKVD